MSCAGRLNRSSPIAVRPPEDMADRTLADWEEGNADVDAKLDPEWVKKYGRQSFEAALTLAGFSSLLEGK